MLHFLLHWTGGDNGTGPIYLEWSGFVGQLSLFVGIGLFIWKHNCHRHGCWRFSKHTHQGTPYCTKHHPTLDKE